MVSEEYHEISGACNEVSVCFWGVSTGLHERLMNSQDVSGASWGDSGDLMSFQSGYSGSQGASEDSRETQRCLTGT